MLGPGSFQKSKFWLETRKFCVIAMLSRSPLPLITTKWLAYTLILIALTLTRTQPYPINQCRGNPLRLVHSSVPQPLSGITNGKFLSCYFSAIWVLELQPQTMPSLPQTMLSPLQAVLSLRCHLLRGRSLDVLVHVRGRSVGFVLESL